MKVGRPAVEWSRGGEAGPEKTKGDIQVTGQGKARPVTSWVAAVGGTMLVPAGRCPHDITHTSSTLHHGFPKGNNQA